MARCSEGEGLRAAVAEAENGGDDDGAAGEVGLRLGLPDVLLSPTALGSASATPWSLLISWSMPVRVQGVGWVLEAKVEVSQ